MILPPDSEKAVGMEVYATDSLPCSARLRVGPDDFEVEEAFGAKAVSPRPIPGSVPLYRVEKRSMDTLHVARALARSLKCRVAYAGMKDKRAAAVQYMTPTSTRAEQPQTVEDPNFTARLVGYLPHPITRSMIAGNRFRITLRKCCSEIGERIAQVLEGAVSLRIPNFYGQQRFGTRDPITHRIGKAIVKGSFDEAVRILLCEPRGADDEGTAEARKLLAAERYAEGARMLPKSQDVESMVAQRLALKPDDKIGALRAAPTAVRRLYVQAFQSFLFNRTLSAAVKEGIDISSVRQGDNWGELATDGLNLAKVHGVREPIVEGAVPLVQLAGFAHRNYGSRFDACLQKVLEEEEIEPRSFFVARMQEVSVEGGFRRPHLMVVEPTSDVAGDTASLRFSLPRGCYATVLLREIVKPSDPFACGFA